MRLIRVLLMAFAGLCSQSTTATAGIVEWASGQDGFWNTAQNWSSNPALPGPGDDVVVNIAGADLTVQHTSGSSVVKSLNSTERLLISGSAMTVTEGSSSLTGGLNLIQNSSLTASGPTTTLSIDNGGTRDLHASNLYALNGGRILYPILYTIYRESWRNEYIADGPGSLIDISGVDTFQVAGGDGGALIAARSGGSLKLGGRFYGEATFEVDGASSVLDFNAVRELPSTMRAFARNGGTLSIPLGEWFQYGELSAEGSGSRVEGSTVTGLNTMSLSASGGGVVSLPNLRRIEDSAQSPRFGEEISVRGAGSSIDLSGVQYFNASMDFYHPTKLSVASGGQLKVGGEIFGRVAIDVAGPTSQFDVSAVSKWTFGADLKVRNGAKVSFPESLADDDFVESLVVENAGSRVDIPAMDFLGVTILATKGAEIRWPQLKRQAGHIRAHGSGSYIDLSGLEYCYGFDHEIAPKVIEAIDGGRIDLAGVVTNYSDFFVNGPTSRINADGVTALDGNIRIQAVNQGELSLQGLTAIKRQDLAAVSGGKIHLGNVVSFNSTANASLVRATGDGSLIDLHGLQSVAAGALANKMLTFEAVQGGRLMLGGEMTGQVKFNISAADSALVFNHGARLVNGAFSMQATGGSGLSLDGMSRAEDLQINATEGATISAPDGLELLRASLTATGQGSRIDLGEVAKLEGRLNINVHQGGHVQLGGEFADIADIAVGGADSALDLSRLDAVNARLRIALTGGAHVPLPTSLSETSLASIALGQQSRLDGLEARTRLRDVSIGLTDGSSLSFSNLEQFISGAESGGYGLQVEGEGSLLDLSNVEHFQLGKYQAALRGNINARQGGEIRLPDVTVGQAQIIADADSVIAVDDLTVSRGGFVVSQYLGELELHGTWRNQALQEADVALAKGAVRIAGEGLQSLEVAGINLGQNVNSTTNQGNFGIGQLILGVDNRAGRLNLLDWVDNGNRSDEDWEALYLFGQGEEDGLTLLHGSTLYLGAHGGAIDVFARVDGTVVHLQSLFSEMNQSIPFGDGFLSNVTLGDFDADLEPTVSDLEMLRGAIALGADEAIYDLDANGVVDLNDLREWLDDVANSFFGDANLDGNVDLTDLNVVRNGFGAASDWSGGDFDGDGLVGLNDLNAVRNHFGVSRQAPASAPVPEPSGFLLAAATALLAGMFGVLRRCGTRAVIGWGLMVCASASSVEAAIYRWSDGEEIANTQDLTPGPAMYAPQRNLEFADLRGFDFTGAVFRESRLYWAKFNGATLVDADLRANLYQADLTGATIQGANLENVSNNVFESSQFYSTASYQNRDLTRVNLTRNDMQGWNFHLQNLTDSQFRLARLNNSSFRGAALERADLSQADLTGVDFSEADLNHARLNDAPLTDADFNDAHIRNARFSQAARKGFTKEQFYSTASYKIHDLGAIEIRNDLLDAWDFSEQLMSSALLVNNSLAGASFRGADLTGAVLENLNLTNADLRGTNLTDALLRESSLAGALLDDAVIERARLMSLTADGFTAEQMYSTATYREDRLIGIEFNGSDLRGWSFAGKSLTNVDFTSTDVRQANFQDTTARGLTKEQFYRTESYMDDDVSGINLSKNNLSGWQLSGKKFIGANFSLTDLSGANLSDSLLTGADFTGAVVRGAKFRAVGTWTSISELQLYSTASYRDRDLTGIVLTNQDLTAWNFAGQRLEGASFDQTDLTNADFSNAALRGAKLQNARWNGTILSGADVGGATFAGATQRGFVSEQLYSTLNYQNHDLAGVDLSLNDLHDWSFVGQDLTGASFWQSTLADADFTAAKIRGANLRETTAKGFAAEQLYATESYQSGRLGALDLSSNQLVGWDLSHQDLGGAQFTGANLTNANLAGSRLVNANLQSVTLSGADFSFADLRGASLFSPAGAFFENTILTNGVVNGLFLAAGDVLVVGDDDGSLPSTPSRAPTSIQINDFALISTEGTLRLLFEADAWDSTIRFAAGMSVQLRGELDLHFAPEVDVASQVGRTFKVFDWTGVVPDGALRLQSPYVWDSSKLFETGDVTLVAVGLNGDTNGDGRVDLIDLNNVRNYFGVGGQGVVGDTNGDALVDLADLNNVRNHFGATTLPLTAPEPATLAMAAILATLTACCRARIQRQVVVRLNCE